MLTIKKLTVCWLGNIRSVSKSNQTAQLDLNFDPANSSLTKGNELKLSDYQMEQTFEEKAVCLGNKLLKNGSSSCGLLQ